MPKEIIFEPRKIGLSNQNQEILRLWTELQQEHTKENPVFIFDLNNKNTPTIPDNRDTKTDKVQHFFHEVFGLDLGVNGQQVHLPPERFMLDFESNLLLDEFTKDLIRMAIEMGCTAQIDSDKLHNTECIEHPFALIKEILIRLTANALDINRGVNGNSANVYKVIKGFIEGLSKLSIAEDKVFFGHAQMSILNSVLSSNLPNWIITIESVVGWVGEVNLTTNIIQANKEKLDQLSKIVRQHLYYNLMCIRGEEKSIDRTTLLDEEWTIVLLENLEKELIKLSNTSTSTELANRDERSFKADVLTKEDENLICKALENSNNSQLIININSLYSSLRGLCNASKIVSTIGGLNRDVGTMPFILKMIEVNNLSTYILKYETFAINACEAACIEKSPLIELKKKIANCKITRITGCNFSELSHPDFINKAVNRISVNLKTLYTLCQDAGCSDVIQWNSNFTMALPQAYESPKVSTTQPKLIGNSTTQSTTIHTTHDGHSIEFEIRPQTYTQNSFFNALGLDRNQILNELLALIKNKDAEIKSIIALEASSFFQCNPLPNELFEELSKDNQKTIKAPMESLKNLCIKLREEIARSGDSVDQLPINDERLLEHLKKINSPVLHTYKTEVDEYNKQKATKEMILQEITTQPQICAAYFKERYIVREADLIYQPNGCFLANKIIAMKKIPVTIWEKNHSGGLQHCESFNQHSDQNNLSSTRHILYTNESKILGDSFFQQLPVKEISMKQNKKPLKDLLAKMIGEDSKVISDEDKISILKYFCVADKTLADENFAEKLANVEKINQQLGTYEEQLNLHVLFKDKGLKYVLEQTLAKAKERLLFNPSISIDKPLLNVLNQEIELTINNYFLTELSNSYQEIQNTKHLVDHPLMLQTNGKSYVVNQSTNSSTPFVLLLQEKGLCYSANADNTYSTFTETLIQGDGQCGFNAMGTDRDEFIITLKEAITRQDNRAILALEILEYIRINFAGNSQFWDRTILTKEMASLLEKEAELEEEIASIKLGLDTKLDKTLTKEQWLDYFDTSKQEADSDTNAYIKRLKNAIKELDKCNKDIVAHCMDQKISNLYINYYKSPSFWLGKYAAKVFAKQHDIALSIYDKPCASIKVTSPLIRLDKETSYQPEKPSKSIHIIYEKGSHFNKLELNDQKIYCPHSAREKYLDILKQEMTQAYISSQPIIGNTLEQYIKKADHTSNVTKALATVSIADQEKIIALNNRLEAEKKLLELKTQHDKERGDLSIPMTDYLKAYDSACFKDLLIQVDEPLNEKKQTLLLKAVENKNIDIVKCLLDLKASGSVESDTDFGVEIKPDYKLDNCVNTYVLKTKPKNNNQWSLKYFDHKGAKGVLEIDKITGLKEVLSKYKEVSLEMKSDIDAILRVHHNIYHKTTPLIKAAHTIGFLDKANQPLFYALLKHSVKEATPHIQEAIGPLLKELSSTFTRDLISHFEKYIKIQEDRDEGLFKAWIQNSPWLQKQFIYWGWDKSPQRAYQIAVLLKSLINGEKNHEYLTLIHDYQSLLIHTKEKENGALFAGLKPIINNNHLKLKEKSPQYQEEIMAYRESRSLESGDARDAISMVLEKTTLAIAELKEAQTKEIAQLKEMQAKEKKEQAIAKEARKKEKDLAKETQKKEKALAKETRKIEKALTKETQEKKDTQDTGEQTKITEQVQKRTNDISQSYPPQEYRSARFFGANHNAIKPKQRTSVKTLSAKFKRLLTDNQWEITQESDDPCDFFTALASEINRVKKKQGPEEVTGKNLRQLCYEFHEKHTKNKRIIETLNESFKKIDEDIFQTDRTTNYQWIRYDTSTQDDQFRIIDGFCAVEGVILLPHYKLPYIFEITVGDNNQIQYAVVSSEQGYTKITDEKCPITIKISQHIDEAPILFIDHDNYYFISKAKVSNLTNNISDDYSGTDIENSNNRSNEYTHEDWSEDSNENSYTQTFNI